MKKKLIIAFLTIFITCSLFARGSYPIETVEMCVAFGLEDYFKTQLSTEYQVVKIHPSDKGAASINQEFVRDIHISKLINSEEKKVCFIYPCYEDKKSKDIKVLPVKVILDNSDKAFDENLDKTITICFAVESEDTELFNFLIQSLKDEKYLESIYKRINKDSYVDYYKIKDKIKVK